jgi:hypothetical protein
MLVLASGRLVGWVTGARSHGAYVLPVDHAPTSFTADIDDDPSETGVLDASTMQLGDLFASDHIVDGETIDTSPDADGSTLTLAPAGIPIGTISASNRSRETHNNLLLTGLVNPSSLGYVQVLTAGGSLESASQTVGMLLSGSEGVIAKRCGSTRCRLTFGNGKVFDCQQSAVKLAEDLARVPVGSCARVPATPQPLPSGSHFPACTGRDLTAIATPPSGRATGRLEDLFVLINHSKIACQTSGAPALKLFTRDQVNDFSIVRTANRGRAAVALDIKPGDEAYFLVVQNTCQSPITQFSTQLRASLPGVKNAEAAQLNLVPASFGYCASIHDPGHTLYVARIDAAPAATYPWKTR